MKKIPRILLLSALMSAAACNTDQQAAQTDECAGIGDQQAISMCEARKEMQQRQEEMEQQQGAHANDNAIRNALIGLRGR